MSEYHLQQFKKQNLLSKWGWHNKPNSTIRQRAVNVLSLRTKKKNNKKLNILSNWSELAVLCINFYVEGVPLLKFPRKAIYKYYHAEFCGGFLRVPPFPIHFIFI